MVTSKTPLYVLFWPNLWLHLTSHARRPFLCYLRITRYGNQVMRGTPGTKSHQTSLSWDSIFTTIPAIAHISLPVRRSSTTRQIQVDRGTVSTRLRSQTISVHRLYSSILSLTIFFGSAL